MKIAFIGYGSMAGALAGKWVANHDLIISGKDFDKASAFAKTLGHGAIAASQTQAVAEAEVVVLLPHHTK
ncbi:MAG: NAD(P)-binding domain-containing protein [Rivularia sp. (in: Bacteria)]|nr:NAD(P)-binding domain-containing protein [Rivularia sp. MS3]